MLTCERGIESELSCLRAQRVSIESDLHRLHQNNLMGIILRRFSVLFTDQFLHQPHYLRHYTKQVVPRAHQTLGFDKN